MIKSYLINFILMFWIELLRNTNGTILNKCFHEGDFTVTCNRSKLPSSNQKHIEVMRYAKVTNGLQHNESLCSYIPGTSCSRTQILSHCVDKPQCHIKNYWFSLEPDCPGNSYYTQFEYDCQPAFYMCDKENLINAFSGLIYSPSYPNTFRTTKSETCYLTVKLPKNHHAEIVLENFDLLSTSKCIGDYLEIQEYVDSSTIQHKRSLQNKTLIKHRKFTSNSNFKWNTLGTMCGRIEQKYTIRAESDTINFKFRPLADDHHFFKDSNSNRKNHMGFKIFFQAIPPKENEPDLKNEKIRETKKPTVQTWVVSKQSEANNNNNQNNLQINPEYSDQDQSNLTLWTLTLALIVLILILLIIVFGCFIYFIKKRQTESKSTSRPSRAIETKSKIPSKSNLNNDVETTPLKPASVPKIEPIKPPSKTLVILEPEPRKMQAERPALLQDLSQSRLLQKFKQEIEQTSPKKEENKSDLKNEIEVIPSPKKEITSEDTSGIYGADLNSLDPKPLYTGSSKVNSLETSPNKKIELAPQILVTNNDQADEIEKIYLEKASREINENQNNERKNSILKSETPKKSTNKDVNSQHNNREIVFVNNPGEFQTQMRKTPAFNPLHVILKDKNKYHTTEYI
ncbi:unnamed protein product [Brachionus calyciflorus]|uniref:CUB domain-containing protein n=1 Tax=Brachionus calyciflorus TaxID=104777 RepID=A0A813YI35_9BILA|nr:unnamed protein product [Brachionus calyciflorus]